MKRYTGFTWVLFVLVLTMAGCVSVGKSGSSQFYVLDTMEGDLGEVKSGEVTVEVRPVKLPEILARPQIVVQKTANEIEVAQTQRWAEPLDLGIARVMAENLALLIPTDQVYTTPRIGSTRVDYQLALEIARFGLLAGGDVVLQARWTLLSDDGSQTVETRFFQVQKPMPDSEAKELDYGAVVGVMGGALADLSQEIAEAIRAASSTAG